MNVSCLGLRFQAKNLKVRKLSIICLCAFTMNSLAVSVSAAASLNATEQKQSFGALKKEAKKLLDNKDYQQAFVLYEKLLNSTKTDKEINAGMALSASATGHYSHAIQAYERLLAQDPNNSEYHVQLAYIYAYTGDIDSADDEMDETPVHHVKMSEELEEKMTLRFNQLRVPHKTTKRSSFMRGQVGLGLMYNTNVNQGPNSNITSLDVFKNRVLPDEKRESSWADYVNIRMEGGKRIESHPNWWLVGDAAAYQRWNFNSSMQNNNGILLGRIAAGAMHMTEKSLVDIRFKTEKASQYHKDSPDQDISTYGPELFVSYSINPQWASITNVSWEKRNYHDPDDNSGNYWSVGEYLQKRFSNTHLTHIGGRIFDSDVDEKDLSHKGYELMVRDDVRFVGNITLNPFLIYQDRHYDGPATKLETKDRKDHQWRLGLTANWRFAKNIAIEGGYQYVNNHSNSELYDYNQHVINSGLVWRF